MHQLSCVKYYQPNDVHKYSTSMIIATWQHASNAAKHVLKQSIHVLRRYYK